MGERPLRQYYATDAGPLPIVVDPALTPMVEPWRAHRERFLGALSALGAADWDHATRCSEWSVRDVVAHLVTVDGFWPVAMAPARDGSALTTYLAGFDPSTSPDRFVRATTESTSDAELLEQHAAALDALHEFVHAFDAETWERRCESPLGHLPARLILAHGYWDSWLHENDVYVGLGAPRTVASDDLLAATTFSLCFAGLQGGLVDDPAAVGPGPEVPIAACLAFEDLPGRAFHLEVGTLADGVRVTACGPDHAPVPAGTAVEFVEGLTGRRPTASATAALPDAVAAQVQRAARTL
jgi:uncharacterized protein (TIGR03083 family)